MAKRIYHKQSIVDGHKWCYKCRETKPVEGGFSKDRTVYGGYSKLCKSCISKSNKNKNRKKKIKTDVEYYLRTKCTRIKHRAKKDGISFDLTPRYLTELYHSQNGLCYYTEEPMRIDCDRVTPDSMSLDRLDPTKGYVEGNVVLCQTSMNAMKQDRTEAEFREFLERRIEQWLRYLDRGKRLNG